MIRTESPMHIGVVAPRGNDTRNITIPGRRRVKKIEYGIGVSVVSGRYSGG